MKRTSRSYIIGFLAGDEGTLKNGFVHSAMYGYVQPSKINICLTFILGCGRETRQKFLHIRLSPFGMAENAKLF